VALTVASVVLVLKELSLTGGLDNATVRFAAEVASSVGLADSDRLPGLQLIDEAAYRERFLETSPLNRPQLSVMIKDILDSKPQLVVIDIDLSPTYQYAGDRTRAAIGQSDLEELLDQAQVDLVLPTPSLSRDETIQKQRTEWVRARCQNLHTHFAFADLILTNGVVLNYDQDFPSLGMVARRLRPPPQQTQPNTGEHSEKKLGWGPRVVCDAVESGDPYAIEVVRRIQQGADAEPLDLRGALAGAREPWCTGVSPCGRQGDKVVFLGGSFDSRDKFWTASGEVDGAFVHAATYWSPAISIGQGRMRHVILVVVEIIVGTLIAFPLSWCWRTQERIRQEYQRAGQRVHVASRERSVL
jgi:hypothetical protein